MEKLEETNPCVPIRIFVGGLGVKVTDLDMKTTFSSLGKVMSVEIIRTNGRSFAYMDFQPTSQKSLDKLFSTYNGCAWKGGRLKLEKAKEHYLARLRREWAEDAELVKGIPNDIVPNVGVVKKSKCMDTEMMKLNIYFPKLKKVKALPFFGAGKHKYSFQRVEVSSSLPIHFCDCPDHCNPETPGKEHVHNKIEVVNDDELKVMNSVMHKLIEREAKINSVDGLSASKELEKSIDFPVQCMESEDDESMELDNLVTNIKVQENGLKLHSTPSERSGKIWEDQENAHLISKLSIGTPLHEHPLPKKKRKNGTSDALGAPLREKSRQLPSVTDDQSPSLAPETAIKRTCIEEQSPAEAHPTKKQFKSAANGNYWMKSSWKELVGQTGDGSFSISQIFQSSASAKQNSSTDSRNQIDVENGVKTQCIGGGPRSFDDGKLGAMANPASSSLASGGGSDKKGNNAGLQSTVTVPKNNPQAVSLVGNEGHARQTAIASKEVDFSKECVFMRSAASEREWKKVRAALTGLPKKKSDQNKPRR